MRKEGITTFVENFFSYTMEKFHGGAFNVFGMETQGLEET